MYYDDDLKDLLWEHCPADPKAEILRNRTCLAPEQRKYPYPDTALVERLTEEFVAAIPEEVALAIGRRVACVEVHQIMIGLVPFSIEKRIHRYDEGQAEKGNRYGRRRVRSAAGRG